LVEQQEDAAVFRAELAKSILDFAEEFGGIVHRRSRYDVLQVIDGLRPPRPLRHPGAATVKRDTHDPRPQRPAGIPAPQAAKDAQKNFLRYVFGVVAVGQEPQT